MTSEEHNKYIAWTFLGHSAFQLLMLLLVMVFMALMMSSIPSGPSPGGSPRAFMWTMFGFMFLFQSFLIIPSLIAAWGLLKHKSWARVASIVAGVIAGLNVPIGTGACIYALWFFLGDSWKEVYGDEAKAAENERRQLVADLETRWTGMRTDEKGEIAFHPVEPPDWR